MGMTVPEVLKVCVFILLPYADITGNDYLLGTPTSQAGALLT